MEIKSSNSCVKLRMPNGKVVDVLTSALEEIWNWLQNDSHKPESGGFIVGYQHENTGNVSLEAVSHPYLADVKSRVRFEIRDPRHQLFLRKARRSKSYYMGVWHTHPQECPIPSDIDWNDWNETMKLDTTGCQFVFFIIAGTKEWRIWAGDPKTGVIEELSECAKGSDGIYIRGGIINEGIY